MFSPRWPRWRHSALEKRILLHLSASLAIAAVVYGIVLFFLCRGNPGNAAGSFYLAWFILVLLTLLVLAVLGKSVLQEISPLSQKLPDALNAEISGTKVLLAGAQEKWEEFARDRQSKKYRFHTMFEEMARLSRQFQQDLHEIVEQLDKISGSLEHQNGSVKQMTVSLGEMSAAVKSTGTLSDNAVASAQASEGDAKRGSEVVNKIIKHMNKIIKTVSKSAEIIQELTKRSDEIVQIINVIDEIAEQTNLLALNAAIEAARAGPQGRGFAIVAEQVRSLAEKTTHATKEIAATLSSIRGETLRAVEAMNEGVKEIDIGQGFAVQAGVNLRKIVAGAQNVSRMISHIAEASEKQSQTSTAITQLGTEAVQEASFTWEDSKTSLTGTRELEKRTEKLSQLIDSFLTLWANNYSEEELIALGEITAQEMLRRARRMKEISRSLSCLVQKV